MRYGGLRAVDSSERATDGGWAALIARSNHRARMQLAGLAIMGLLIAAGLIAASLLRMHPTVTTPPERPDASLASPTTHASTKRRTVIPLVPGRSIAASTPGPTQQQSASIAASRPASSASPTGPAAAPAAAAPTSPAASTCLTVVLGVCLTDRVPSP